MNTDVLNELIDSNIFSNEYASRLNNLKEYITKLEEFKRTANLRVNTEFTLDWRPRFIHQAGDHVPHRHFVKFTNAYTYQMAKDTCRKNFGRAGSQRQDSPIWEYFDSNHEISFHELRYLGRIAQELFSWKKVRVNASVSPEDMINYYASLPENTVLLCHQFVGTEYLIAEAFFLNDRDAIVFELKFG